ncbi:hypothetical protein HK104_008489 [Borealophlyctis nickersoniae]|nr:hypothetical protein HK104_008489 [Borealophlyctis nickersoniae]
MSSHHKQTKRKRDSPEVAEHLRPAKTVANPPSPTRTNAVSPLENVVSESHGPAAGRSIPELLDPSVWTYKAEGNANLVLSYTGSNPLFHGHVLRLRKEDVKASALREKQRPFTVEYDEAYHQNVIAPLLGKQYVGDANLLAVTQDFLRSISHAVNPSRPEGRRGKNVDLTEKFAALMTDHTVMHKSAVINSSADTCIELPSTLSVELKPKWGFLPAASGDALKLRTCRYCMHQYYKIQHDAAHSVNNFCPLDLYSGDANRMREGFNVLGKNPQNNLKVFLDGVLRDLTEDSTEKLLDAFFSGHGYNGLVALLTTILAKDPLLATLKMRQQTLDPHDIEKVHRWYQSVIDEGGSIMDPTEEEWVKIVEMYLERMTGTGIQSEKLDSPDPPNAPSQDVALSPRAKRKRSPPVVDSTDNIERKSKKPKISESDDHDLSHSMKLQRIFEFMISVTLKDLSIMITFSRDANPPTETTINTVSASGRVKLDNAGFEYKMRVVDIDPKRVSKIPHYLQQDKDIVSGLSPPAAKQAPHIAEHHGRKRVDEYKWMEDSTSKDTQQYMEAEKRYIVECGVIRLQTHIYSLADLPRYASHILREYAPVKRRIAREMRDYLPRAVPPAPPDTIDGWDYYTRHENGALVYFRRYKDGVEQTLLNNKHLPNPSHTLKKVLTSPDHKTVAYLVCAPAEESGTLYLRDVSEERRMTTRIDNVFNMSWGDGQVIYFTRLDEQLRSSKVFRHHVKSHKPEVLVYHERDPAFFVDVGLTKDKKYLTISCNANDTSEVLIVPAASDVEKIPDPVPLFQRTRGVEYYVDHHETHFYILNNTPIDPELTLSLLPSHHALPSSWALTTPWLATSPDKIKIEEVELFRKHAVLFTKRAGVPTVECCNVESGERWKVEGVENGACVFPGVNLDYEATKVRFQTTSPFTMSALHEYDLMSRRLTTLTKQTPVGFDRSPYVTERIHVPAEDGVDIPVTVVRRRDMKFDGSNPVSLRVYGAYGVPLDPVFNLDILPLLKRGFVVAFAHVRGGGDLGRTWHTSARLHRKPTSTSDFLTVATHFISQNYTTPALLTATTSSAGGIILGSVLNTHPDLFRAMVLRVPFLDPVSAMLDQDLPLTSVEVNEWGDPARCENEYDALVGYAPYDNIPARGTRQLRTSVLVTAGVEDMRVPPWQVLKWTARVRDRFMCDGGEGKAKVVVRVLEGRGHGAGAAGERVEDTALENAFLIREIGFG